MKEVVAVVRQLERIMENLADQKISDQTTIASIKKELSMPPPPPPSLKQEKILRQIITAGLMDRVARKTSFGEIIAPGDGDEVGGEGGRGAYELVRGGVAYIHPSSSLFPPDRQPQYVAFFEIVETSRRYMKAVTAIEPRWLTIVGSDLCTDSAPLEQPMPVYDPKKDAIFCFVRTTFGPRRWELPHRKLPYPSEKKTEIVRHFARLLLSGKIVKALGEFCPYLSIRPASLVNPILPRKAKRFLSTLTKGEGVKTLSQLLELWQKDPKFLLDEYLELVQWQKQDRLKSMWPPVTQRRV